MNLFTQNNNLTTTRLWKNSWMIMVIGFLTAMSGQAISGHLASLSVESDEDVRPFITIWKTDNSGVSEDNQIIIPTDQSEDLALVYNYNVYWEEVDNPTNNGSAAGLTGDYTIDFPAPGTYRVEIMGQFPKIYFNNTGDKSKILSVEQWGDIEWRDMQYSFYGCDNIAINAVDAPDLGLVTNMSGMFRASSINQSINHWDVSNVTDMSQLFRGATDFNKPLNNWNVSNVIFMNHMFFEAINFNQDIGSWDLSSVTATRSMFYNANSFDRYIGDWHIGNVTNMQYMFYGAKNFNQDISGWDVSNVTNLNSMFYGASDFDQDLNSWNVANVIDMALMFSLASNFKHDLAGWNVSNVTTMDHMLNNTAISPIDFELTLQGWLEKGVQNNVTLGAKDLNYCIETGGAREYLITNHSWSIVGDTRDCSQGITFMTLPEKVYGDDDFMLTGTVSSGNIPQYTSSNVEVATINGNIVAITGAGVTTITATQPGNDYYAPADPISRELKVNKAEQTIIFEPLEDKIVGDESFELIASVNSDLAITFSSLDEAVATVEGNVVTIVGAGTTIITASQEGNANYKPAQSVEQPLQVNKKPQAITFDAIAEKNIGDGSFELVAFSDSELAITFVSADETVATVEGNTVTIVGVGSTIITASQPGNVEFEPAEPVLRELVVTKVPQVITFEPLMDMPSDAPDFEINAFASSGLEVVLSISGPANLEGNTISLTGMPGTVRVTASQAGNETYGPAESVMQVFEVFLKTPQTIVFEPIPTKYIGDDDFDLVATVDSGLEITFVSSDESVATIVGRTVTIIGEGTIVITASQSGNDNYQAAIPVEQTLTVSKKSQTITFDALPSKTILDDDFDLTAVASSGLAVIYTSSNEQVATVVGNKVTIIGLGTTTITASQAGNAEYAESSDVSRELVITKVPQEITFEPIGDRSADAPSFEIIASASSGLPIIFTVSGPAAIEGNEISLKGTPGVVSVTATQGGNDIYSNAEPVVRTFEVLAAPVTGVQDLHKEGISIYPNPVYDRLIIDLAKNNQTVIYVSDAGGNVVLEKRLEANSNQVDISSLSSGLYFIKIQLADKVLYHKVVKE